MEKLQRFVTVVFGLCLAVVLSILVMIKGWGLEPKSYFWIIGVNIVGAIIAQLVIQLGTKDD